MLKSACKLCLRRQFYRHCWALYFVMKFEKRNCHLLSTLPRMHWVKVVCYATELSTQELLEKERERIREEEHQKFEEEKRRWKEEQDEQLRREQVILLVNLTFPSLSIKQLWIKHYENKPIQICWKFYCQKWKFSDKNLDIFHIIAQNIDCGYLLELPLWGSSKEYSQSMFLSRNMNNYVCPSKPSFTI